MIFITVTWNRYTAIVVLIYSDTCGGGDVVVAMVDVVRVVEAGRN